MKLKAFALFILLFQFEVTAATRSITDPLEQERTAKLDELYSACMQQKKRDKLCDSVITAKQIGNDSVEYIKEYMDLSPTAYAFLTIANFISTGRFRIKTKSFFIKKAQHIYDYQRDDNQITFIIEKSF